MERRTASKSGSMDSETETSLYNGKNDCMSTNEDGYILAKMEKYFTVFRHVNKMGHKNVYGNKVKKKHIKKYIIWGESFRV